MGICRCGHEQARHYTYIRNGVDTEACADCDPFNKPKYAGATTIGVNAGSYDAAMHEAMNHPFAPEHPQAVGPEEW